MIIQRITYLVFGILMCYLSHCQNSSQLVYMDQGKLSYAPFSMRGQTNNINTVPDFSYAGYMGGGISLPLDISIQAIITPEEGDDTRRIQNAINYVESLEPDQNGFRGVILIKAGYYSLENVLTIKESGVVLRGEGQGLKGTVLHSNPRVEHSIINILGPGGITKDMQSVQKISSDYVPVGAYSFEVSDASGYEVGDKIVVIRTPNQSWINELGMDSETLCEEKTDCNGWESSDYAIEHERIITSISDDTIFINIPMVDVIEHTYGGGTISKVISSRRISQCGVENMRIQSFYDGDLDESHAWTAVRLNNSENCWVKQITGQYLAYSTVNIESANFTTVQDCAYIDPKSQVSGGRRYSYAIQEGLGNLFQRCYAINGRHDFTTGSRVTGPNVFLDGLAESVRSDIGPHHRWATGTLFDNIRGGPTRVWNRGNFGSGHGWAGAQTMFWNIDSYTGELRVDSPLGAINWGIGCIGRDQTGDGYWESWGANVEPRSIYLQQLEDRLGVSAVSEITIPEQRSEKIYELLSEWGGQGSFSDGGFYGEIPSVSFINPTNPIDVPTWEGSDIHVDASDSDGTIQSVQLLINGEPVAKDTEAPYIFNNITTLIQNLSHQKHFLQIIVIDNDGNTNSTRLAIFGGDPPPEMEEEIMDEEKLKIRVFPNPTQNGEINIEMIEEGFYTGKLFDLQGRKLDQFSFDGLKHQFLYNNIIDGIYILEIENKEEVIFKSKIFIK